MGGQQDVILIPHPLCPLTHAAPSQTPHRIDEHAGGGVLLPCGTAQLQADGVGDAPLQADGMGQHHIPGTERSKGKWIPPASPVQLSPAGTLTGRQTGGWWKAGHQPGWCSHMGCWQTQGWGAAPAPSPPSRALGAACKEKAEITGPKVLHATSGGATPQSGGSPGAHSG